MVADGRTVPGEHPFHDPADLTHRTMSGVPVLGMLDRHAKQAVRRIGVRFMRRVALNQERLLRVIGGSFEGSGPASNDPSLVGSAPAAPIFPKFVSSTGFAGVI